MHNDKGAVAWKISDEKSGHRLTALVGPLILEHATNAVTTLNHELRFLNLQLGFSGTTF